MNYRYVSSLCNLLFPNKLPRVNDGQDNCTYLEGTIGRDNVDGVSRAQTGQELFRVFRRTIQKFGHLRGLFARRAWSRQGPRTEAGAALRDRTMEESCFRITYENIMQHLFFLREEIVNDREISRTTRSDFFLLSSLNSNLDRSFLDYVFPFPIQLISNAKRAFIISENFDTRQFTQIMR